MKESAAQLHLVGVMEERRSCEDGLMEVSRAINSAVTANRALLLCAERTRDKDMIVAARRNLRRVEAIKRAISHPELWSTLTAMQTRAQELYKTA